MTCAIIDDEPLAADLLASYARKTPFLELSGIYNSAIEAMRVLRTKPVDLIFLDIQMPELSGLEFATILPTQTMVVFTTAFDRYAVESYKVNAVDYLLKPISFDDFLTACDKVQEQLKARQKQDTYRQDRFVFVKSEYKLQRVLLDDILYIEGLKDYVRIYMRNSEKIISLMSMKRLEEHLPQPEFLRTHRSYIVHMPEVNTIDRFRFVFGDQYIPISENYKEQVLQYLDQHTLG